MDLLANDTPPLKKINWRHASQAGANDESEPGTESLI